MVDRYTIPSRLRVMAFGLALALVGCSSSTKEDPLDTIRAARKEKAQVARLITKFEDELEIRSDPKVSAYLLRIAEQLAKNAKISQTDPQIILVRNKDKWNNFHFPGYRIYLSLDLLKKTEYESEVAGALAIQIAHLMKKELVLKIKKKSKALQPIYVSGPSSIFHFSEESEIAAIQSAVSLLYQAKYDTRGVITWLGRYLEYPKHSPFKSEIIQKFIDEARNQIALQTPLRNPIIRPKEFLEIHKRIENL